MAGRRFALYFSWSREGEAKAPLGVLDNRFPALFEFRRVLWPNYEWASDPERFDQSILGFLDDVILFDFKNFCEVVESATSHKVKIVQRKESASSVINALSNELLDNVDTLIIVSLDHLRTEQRVMAEELASVQKFLAREDACLVVCPHHDIGAAEDEKQRIAEHDHHGDLLVPSQQRIGGFARSLLSELGLLIDNRYGLNPAKLPDGSPSPLEITQQADELKVLEGVRTFNLHPHLPHLALSVEINAKVRVLAHQRINPAATWHPFVAAGNELFNALLWAPPDGERAGNLFVCDATLWSSAFGGNTSLIRFWQNLCRLPVRQ